MLRQILRYFAEWHAFYPFTPKVLTDGSRSEWGEFPLMRRRANGRWQYRRCTAAEEQAEADARVW